jgi:hypothetical protein
MKNTRLGVEDLVEIAKLCALACSCKAALAVAGSWKTSAAMQGPRGAGDDSDGGAGDAMLLD